MPNIKSAEKRVRTSAEKQERNKSVKTKVTSLKKKFLDAVSQGDKAIADQAYRSYISGVDKAVKHGVIKSGNADRRKSRATSKITAM